MSSVLEYNGYHASIEFDAEDMIFFGTVFGINDSLSFHATSVPELNEMFRQCIDNYLERCKEIGKTPEKEFSGTFNVRISPERHREIALSAFEHGCSLNKEVDKAIEYYLLNNDSLSNPSFIAPMTIGYSLGTIAASINNSSYNSIGGIS